MQHMSQAIPGISWKTTEITYKGVPLVSYHFQCFYGFVVDFNRRPSVAGNRNAL